MMLFHVKMDVNLPNGMAEKDASTLKAKEKTYSQRLQSSGKWRHIWRIAGHYSNISVFDVDSVEELHQLLSDLPLYPYMTMQITPLCRHPSSVREGDY